MDDKSSMSDRICSMLSITKNRFPKPEMLEMEINGIFFDFKEYSLIKEVCYASLKCFSHLVLEKHMYEINWNTFTWLEARQAFSREMSQSTKLINVDCMYKLLFEEFWWRLHGFHDYKAFAHIPTQLELKKENPTQDESVFINYYDLEVKSHHTQFKIGKQAHDFIRYFVFGYHFAIPLKESKGDKWWTCMILKMDPQVENVILIDLDNAGKSPYYLSEVKFAYPKTKFIAFCGTGMKETNIIKQCVSDGHLELYKVNLLQPLEEMDQFERYLDKFYDNNYFKKYKNAADYALSAFCGALHRLLPLNVNILIISKDDGLDWPNRHLNLRGRRSEMVPQDNMIKLLNEKILGTVTSKLEILDLCTHQIVVEKMDPVQKEHVRSSFTKKEVEQSWFVENEEDRVVCELAVSKAIAKTIETSVKILKFRGLRTGPLGVSSLIDIAPDLAELSRLELRGTRARDESMSKFLLSLNTKSLMHIDLSTCLMCDASSDALNTLLKSPILQFVDLRWNKFSYLTILDVIETIESSTSLQTMIWRDNKIGYEGIEKILTCSNESICNLDLYRCSDRDCGYIFNEKILLKNLTHLDLSGNCITKGIHSIANWLVGSSLSRLIVDYNGFGDDGCLTLCKALTLNQTLVCLSIERCCITDIGAHYLAETLKTNETLTFLDLQRNNIGDLGMIALARALNTNVTLWYLNTKRNQIGDLGIIELSRIKNPTISILDFGYNAVTHVGVMALAKNLHRFESVTEVCFTNNLIGDTGMEALCKNLCKTSHLIVDDCDLKEYGLDSLYASKSDLSFLKMNTNKIGRIDMLDSLDELKKWITMTVPKEICFTPLFKNDLIHLDLSENILGDEGMESLLCEALITSKNLAYLNVSSNFCTLQSFKRLAKLLEVNQSIVSLIASNNSCNDEGIACICDALKLNNTLTTLVLDTCVISSVGLSKFAKCLEYENSVIAVVSMCNNLIDDKSMEDLALAVQKCNSISVLNLDRNKGITQAGRKILLEKGTKCYSCADQMYCVQILL
jgi:Ran GTPase-activating protein (RanGAP) involved in mRNA processing and transport